MLNSVHRRVVFLIALLAGLGASAEGLIITNDSSRNWFLAAPMATRTLTTTLHLKKGTSGYFQVAVFDKGKPIRLTLEPNCSVSFAYETLNQRDQEGIDQPFTLTDSDGRRLSPTTPGPEDFDLKVINMPFVRHRKNVDPVKMIAFREPGDMARAGRYRSSTHFRIKQPSCLALGAKR